MRALLIGLVTTALAGSCGDGRAASATPSFDAARAWRDLEAQCALGPRPAGSEALEELRALLERELAAAGLRPVREAFVAETPRGEIPMVNLWADLPAAGDPAAAEWILLVAHYETKREPAGFLGANDNASGTAVLLELARVLARGGPRPLSYRFLFVDGEEAIRREWRDPDNRYGSRHHAEALVERGLAPRVRACVLIDMVGDADLRLANESYSDPRLAALLAEAARAAGHPELVERKRREILDDHLSFMAVGIPAIDVIDFEFGPGNAYWHTLEDAPARCSEQSLASVGEVLLAFLPRIEREFRRPRD